MFVRFVAFVLLCIKPMPTLLWCSSQYDRTWNRSDRLHGFRTPKGAAQQDCSIFTLSKSICKNNKTPLKIEQLNRQVFWCLWANYICPQWDADSDWALVLRPMFSCQIKYFILFWCMTLLRIILQQPFCIMEMLAMQIMESLWMERLAQLPHGMKVEGEHIVTHTTG